MIDLHSHTTASDGQHSPTELLQLAARSGVVALSVTDHDTVGGLLEAQVAAQRLGIELVPGIELSAFLEEREIHVLGHFINPTHPELVHFSALLGRERETRMGVMVDKMRGLGFPVSLEEVKALAKGAQLGRPHLAMLLVEKGYCKSTKNAFDRFLGSGRPAWADRYRLSVQEAIGLIRRAGGVATIAHPGVSRIERHDLERMKAWDLGGLEVFHPEHVPSAREKFLGFATAFGLTPTAGSDFHGAKVSPGRSLGMATMPKESFEALRQRRPS